MLVASAGVSSKLTKLKRMTPAGEKQVSGQLEVKKKEELG